jgi:hypothetical protein
MMNFIENEKKKVYVYPTPENVDKIQYKDFVNNCYEFESNIIECGNDAKVIPMQT